MVRVFKLQLFQIIFGLLIKLVFLLLPSQKIILQKINHMYAIVNIAGQQFKVQNNDNLFVHRLDAEEGATVNFDRVLLVDDDGSVKVGAPTVSGANVTARVINHLKGDKVLVFKKKRRKSYQKMNGHRQYLTKIQIENISI